MHFRYLQNGFTLIELLISTAIALILLSAMSSVIDHSLHANNTVQLRNETIQTTHIALQRMVTNVATTRQLLIPLNDNSSTALREHIREETVPASPPPSGSSKSHCCPSNCITN